MIRGTVEGRVVKPAFRHDCAQGSFDARELVASQLDGAHPRVMVISTNARHGLALLPEGANVRVDGDLMLGVWDAPDGTYKPRATLRVRRIELLKA
jgi:hypothetical protein